MKSLVVVGLAFLLSIKWCSADLIPTRSVEHSNYSEDLGFSVNAMIHNKSKNGLINYHVALGVPYNEFLGVTAAVFRDEKVVSRFSLTGDKIPYKKNEERMVFEFECAPEEAQNIVIAFQVKPPDGEVAFIRLKVSTWPVSIVGDGAIVATVPVGQVRAAIEQDAKK